MPENIHLTLRVTPQAGVHAFGLCVRAEGEYAGGHELRIEPSREKVGWQAAAVVFDRGSPRTTRSMPFEGLADPFTLGDNPER